MSEEECSSCGGERSIKRGTLQGRVHLKYHPDIVPTAQRVRLRPRGSDSPEVTEQSILPALHEARASDSTSANIRGSAVWRGYKVAWLTLGTSLAFLQREKDKRALLPFHTQVQCSFGFL